MTTNKNHHRLELRVAAAAFLLLAMAVGAPPAAAQTSDARFDVVCIVSLSDAKPEARPPCVDSIPVIRFSSEISLAVEHAPEVDFDDAAEPDPARLVLFLEGKAIPGSRARVGKSYLNDDGTTTTILTFRVTRDLSTATARANWKEVIVAARHRPTLAISTGVENGAPARTRAEVEFEVLDEIRLFWWLLGAAVLAAIFLWTAIRTGLLRDLEPAPAGDPVLEKPRNRAYSLARVQMAVWTLLIALAFLYVWCLTRDYSGVLNTTALVLMGISTGTLATAAGVDSQKLKTNEQTLEDEEAKLAAAGGQPAVPPKVQALKNQTQACKSEGFFRDILTSADGPSLHRLQFILWTVVLMVVFATGVWETLTMPEFDETLLGLMGISSGAYVGLKLPELKS